MTDRLLGSASSIPCASSLMAEDPSNYPLRGGEAEPSDWRYWLARAYLGWLRRSEQLTLFEEEA